MKILIIRFSSIGDILLTSAFIRQIRRKYPDARIDFIIKKKFFDLVRFSPHLNHIYVYDEENQSGLKKFAGLFNDQKYTYIFDLHNNLRSIYLRNNISTQKRSYIKKDKIAQALLVGFKINIYKVKKSIPDRYLDVGKPAGIEDDHRGLEIFWDEPNELAVKRVYTELKINSAIPTIGIAPGAGFFTKRWPLENFLQLIEQINNKYELNIIIIGGKTEREMGTKLNGLPNVYNFAGRLGLLESGIVISQLRCLITNDSGMMHMAACVNTPVIAIFGSSVKEFGFYPFRVPGLVVENTNAKCRPCSHIGKNACPKNHFKCMREITPQIVYNKVSGFI